MLIVVLFFIVLLAVLAGAVWLYHTLLPMVGTALACLAVLAALAVLGAVPFSLWRLRRLPGAQGKGLYRLRGAWGSLELDAHRHLLRLETDGASSVHVYVFADIASVEARRDAQGHWLAFTLREHPATVRLPMSTAHQAHGWVRVLQAAAAQRLPA